jgi:hypothetical protein
MENFRRLRIDRGYAIKKDKKSRKKKKLETN